MSTYKAAQELEQDLAHLEDLDAVVTTDQEKAQAGVNAGSGVVFIAVPDIEDMSGTMLELDFQLLIISPSRTDKASAWQQLDKLLAAVDDAIGLDSARAYDWRTTAGETFPAFDCKHTQIRPKENL